MKFYRDLAPGHSRILAGHVTPPGDLTLGQAWRQKPLPKRYSTREDQVSSMVTSMPYQRAIVLQAW